MTPKQENWYQSTLAGFAQPGNRYSGVTALTWCAASLGISADDVIQDAHAAGVRDRDGDIRRGIESAIRKGAKPADGRGDRSRYRRRPVPAAKPCAVPDFVRRMIALGGGSAGFADIRAQSIQPIDFTPQTATAIWLVSLYGSNDYLHIFNKVRMEANPRKASLGWDFRTVADFLKLDGNMLRALGDCISRNQYTGHFNEAAQSYTVKDCIARPRYALIEFDAMPLDRQCAFWLGFLKDPQRAATVASIVFSGNKSLHGLLEIPAGVTWEKWTANLAALFWSDETDAYTRTNKDGKQEMVYPFKCDKAGLTANGNTRIAGGRRSDSGAIQELLYLAGTF